MSEQDTLRARRCSAAKLRPKAPANFLFVVSCFGVGSREWYTHPAGDLKNRQLVLMDGTVLAAWVDDNVIIIAGAKLGEDFIPRTNHGGLVRYREAFERITFGAVDSTLIRVPFIESVTPEVLGKIRSEIAFRASVEAL